jgi:hypothetical protein
MTAKDKRKSVEAWDEFAKRCEAPPPGESKTKPKGKKDEGK